MLTSYHILTNEGQNLITRALVENKAIDFMYYRAGDGDVATIDEIKLLTNIFGNLIKQFTVSNISKVSPSTTNVSGQYDNTGIVTPVSVTEYGLFAKLDGDATEVLFSYQGLGAGFILHAYSGTLITQIVDFTITMTQDVGVVVKFNPSALVDMSQIVQEPLTKVTSKILSSTASNILFENGVGKAVSGYIEDGTSHAVGEVWISKNTKGEFKCLVANTDNFIDVAKWLQIDDLTNASKLENLRTITTTGNIEHIISSLRKISLICYKRDGKVFVSGGAISTTAPYTTSVIVPPEYRPTVDTNLNAFIYNETGEKSLTGIVVRINANGTVTVEPGGFPNTIIHVHMSMYSCP